MLDFLRIKIDTTKKETVVYPDFKCVHSNDANVSEKDLLVKGGALYAIWDDRRKRWYTTKADAARIIDEDIDEYVKEHFNEKDGIRVKVKYADDNSSKVMHEFWNYIRENVDDTDVQLDAKLVFKSDPRRKKDYSTKRLSYDLIDCPTPGYNELMRTLYSDKERAKIEWLIGCVIAGENHKVQKFGVLYGAPKTGKSTVINIIQSLFEGYCIPFDAAELGKASATFALESFRTNPVVAYQHDGDLSHIESNTRLNSIASHEEMEIKQKYKQSYYMRFDTIMFIGSNSPVKITEAKSGLLRRLIDITPTGNRLDPSDYDRCMDLINFELGGIAKHCLDVYLSDKKMFDKYRPVTMMEYTNDFYDFMLNYYDVFKSEEYTTLAVAWERYKNYVEDANVNYKMSRRAFSTELSSYFNEGLHDIFIVDNDGSRKHLRSVYSGFKSEMFYKGDIDDANVKKQIRENDTNEDLYEDVPEWLHLENFENLGYNNPREDNPLQAYLKNAHAQYATTDDNEIPKRAWKDKNGDWNVSSKLIDILPNKVHYVMSQEVDGNLIVIDFDKKGEDGKKSLRENLLAAKIFPKTYAEVSKGGQGLHLHYIYDGDADDLSRLYDDNIEIKVFKGLSALRRRLSLCNNEQIAHINSGLPLRGDRGRKDAMVNWSTVKNEKQIRTLIRRNLCKEYHADTTSSVHFIKKILDEAYESGITYDVRDLRGAVLNFAQNASNQSQHCMECVMDMEFKSKDILDDDRQDALEPDDDNVTEEQKAKEDKKPIVFFDIEVFPNLFVVCYKKKGPGGKEACVKMINPTANEIAALIETCRLVGFNNLEYDNILLYARMIGYTVQQLYELSCKIINRTGEVGFHESKKISYTDVFDFANKKQGLKKWEVELNIHHQELGLDWNKPVPEELWHLVADYCCNDVVSTEVVFDHLVEDWNARQMLASLSGLTVNDKTNAHSIRILFGKNKNPQKEFIYTDLSSIFPGYEFCATGIDKNRYVKDEKGKPIIVKGKSIYMNEDPSEGGYVYAEPGIHVNVALLDIASLHPTSLECLQAFGPRYTKRFSEIKQARIFVKHKEWDNAMSVLNGALKPFLEGVSELTADEQQDISDGLAYALKIVINSIYGLTSATFPNACKDPRNIDNIVAKRGALFMITLKHEVQKRGFTVAHVKTDSIKIPNATKEIIDFVMEFGKKYGYSFEHEATYKKMCLVNDAVYIAKYDEYGERTKGGKHANCWTATGKQFQIPYVFKTLFSHEQIEFNDVCEVMSVSSGASIFLDMDEKFAEDRLPYEKTLTRIKNKFGVSEVDAEGKMHKVVKESLLPEDVMEEYQRCISEIDKLHDYHFVGAIGQFCPVRSGNGGGTLVRGKDGKYAALAGTKGYRWFESEIVRLNHKEDCIDKEYYRELVDKAYDAISKYGDAEEFVNG